jgi:hypothetical protein
VNPPRRTVIGRMMARTIRPGVQIVSELVLTSSGPSLTTRPS